MQNLREIFAIVDADNSGEVDSTGKNEKIRAFERKINYIE